MGLELEITKTKAQQKYCYKWGGMFKQSARNHYQHQFWLTNKDRQKFISSTFKTLLSSSSGRDVQ